MQFLFAILDRNWSTANDTRLAPTWNVVPPDRIANRRYNRKFISPVFLFPFSLADNGPHDTHFGNRPKIPRLFPPRGGSIPSYPSLLHTLAKYSCLFRALALRLKKKSLWRRRHARKSTRALLKKLLGTATPRGAV